jgi:hypothetical protein
MNKSDTPLDRIRKWRLLTGFIGELAAASGRVV